MLLENVLNFLYPETCILCGKIAENYICKNCEKRFNKYKRFNIIDNEKMLKDKLGICEIPIYTKYYEIDKQKIYWDKLLYCFEYKNIVRKYILQYKFFEKAYLSKFFTYEILKNKKVYELLKNYDIIISVPMDKVKRKQRGYNQTELIVKKIDKEKILKYEDCVEKIRKTKTQSLLKFEERKSNIKDAFKIKSKENIKDKNVVLFDDIYTTGATVNELSRILKNAGAKKILILILAKD